MFIEHGATHKLLYRFFIAVLASTQIYVSFTQGCKVKKTNKVKKGKTQRHKVMQASCPAIFAVHSIDGVINSFRLQDP